MNQETTRFNSPDHSLADSAAAALHDVGDQAGALADRTAQALRDRAHDLQVRAQRASQSTAAYIQQEPVKSLLMAAAAGAVLMGLLSLWRARAIERLTPPVLGMTPGHTSHDAVAPGRAQLRVRCQALQ